MAVETFRKDHWIVYSDGQVAVSDLDLLLGKQGGCLDCRVVQIASGQRFYAFFYRSPHGFFLDVVSDRHPGLKTLKTDSAANKFMNSYRSKFTTTSDYHFIPDLDAAEVLQPASLRTKTSMKAALDALGKLFSGEAHT